jgi:hypothetical protein
MCFLLLLVEGCFELYSDVDGEEDVDHQIEDAWVCV